MLAACSQHRPVSRNGAALLPIFPSVFLLASELDYSHRFMRKSLIQYFCCFWCKHQQSSMDTPAPPYESPNAQIYQPLSSPDSIRILTLFECDSEDDDIECHLAEVRRSDLNEGAESYIALSYAWGEVHFSHEIWLGDQRFLIGANLHAALRHLRRRDRPIRLWVDAVCINQADLTEKSSQVQQMRNIFSAASETIIWLGPAGGNTSVAAWNFLERHSTWALNDTHEVDYTRPAKLEEELLSFRGEFRDVEIDVLSRPWFRRLWVFQEAVLSRTLSVQCGYRRIAWDDFAKTVLQSDRRDDRYGFSMRDDGRRDIVQAISQTRREYLQRRGPQETPSSSQLPPSSMLRVLKLLHRGRYLRVSDAKDKIFGFLGIAEGIDTNDPRFRVDYNLSPRTLYTQFARNVIETTNSMEILSYVDFSTPFKQGATVETPSWAPCWDYESPFVNRGVHYRSNLTMLDTLPRESSQEREARQIRVAGSNIIWSHSESQFTTVDSMEVSGRIVGRIGPLTGSIRVNGNDQALFQHLTGAVEDENEALTLSMALWARKLTSTSYSLDLKAGKDFIDRAKFDGVPWEDLGRPDEDDPDLSHSQSQLQDLSSIHLSLKQATLYDPNLPVYAHLYRRGQATATWSGQNLDRDVPRSYPRVIDEESIVDGRRLAIIRNETDTDADESEHAAGRLALVPGSASEGDMIIQISGARVPFVIRKGENDWTEIASITKRTTSFGSSYSKPMKSWTFPWELIGECLLNGFEELAENDMDTRFRLV